MKKLVIFRVAKDKPEIYWAYTDPVSKEETNPLFQKEYIPQAKDRLYIFPGCTIPRFKLKLVCDNYNIAISKTKDKANIIISDPDANIEDRYFKSFGNCYQAMKKPLLDYLRKSSASLGELIQAIENLEEDTVLIHNTAIYHFREWGLNGRRYIFIDEDDVEYGKYTTSEINCLPECISLRQYLNDEAKAEFLNMATAKKLYHQDAIIKLINGSAAVIDESMYQSLRSMFESNNNSDIQVAMEAMANCDIEKSITYLLLLFKEYGKDALYNHPSKHHVNFKSLTKYLLGKGHYMHNLDIDNCVEILRDKGLLNSQNLSVFMKEAKEIVREKGETEYFVVTDVIPREDIQKIVKDTDANNVVKELTIRTL